MNEINIETIINERVPEDTKTKTKKQIGRPKGSTDKKKRKIRPLKENRKQKPQKQEYELIHNGDIHICKTYAEMGRICNLSSQAIQRIINKVNANSNNKSDHLRHIKIRRLEKVFI